MIRPDGTVSDAILTTLTPADRIPSVGTQLTIRDDLHARADAGDPIARAHGFGDAPGPDAPPRPWKPERLTLWDQTASLEL